MGLGFSFGGRDSGMGDQIANQTKHLSLMGQAVETLNKILSINRLQTFIDSISLSRLNDIAHGIEQIGIGGLNLNTSLETQVFENNRALSSYGAKVGKTGKELAAFKEQSQNIAIGLKIDSKAAGDAVYGYEEAGGILAKAGIKNATEFAKFSEVAGVSANDFAYALSQQKKQTGMSDEAMVGITDQMMQFAKKANTVTETLGSVSEMTDMLRTRVSMGFKPEQVADFAKQTYGVAESFYAITRDGKKSQAMAMQLSKTLTESGKDFQGMFSGTKEDLNSLTQELIISGVSADDAFDQMNKGPNDFIKMMAGMADKVEKSGGDTGKVFQFVRDRLSQSGLGPEMSETIMVGLTDPLKRAQLASMDLTKTATGGLKSIEKGFVGPRDLAERFEFAQEKLVKGFRAITRTKAADFVAKSEKAFHDFGKSLQKLADPKKKGLLPMFVRQMSLAHQIGAQAFIPEVLRPMAVLAGTAVKEMAPMLGMLGSLGFRLGMLLNPFVLVGVAVGALVAWFVALRLSGKSTEQALEEMGNRVAEFFYGLPLLIQDGLDSLAKMLTGGFSDAVGEEAPWKEAWARAWEQIKKTMSFLWKEMKKIGVSFWEGLTGSITGSSADSSTQIGQAIGTAFRDALKYAWEVLKKGAKDLLSGDLTGEGLLVGALGLGTLITFGGPILAILSGVGTALGVIWSVVAFVAPILFTVVTTLFEVGQVAVWVVSALSGLSSGVVLLIGFVAALTAGFMLWPEKTQEAVDWVSAKLKWFGENAFELITTGIIMAVDFVIDLLGGGGEKGGKSFFDGIVDWIIQLPRMFYGFMGQVAIGLGKAINGILSMLEGLVLGALDGIKNALMKRFPASAEVISNVFETIKGIVADTFGFIKIGVTVVAQVISTVFNLIGNVVSTIWNFVAGLTGWLFDTIILPYFTSMWEAAKFAFDFITSTISLAAKGWVLIWETIIKPVWDAVGPYFGALWTGVTNGVKEIQTVVEDIFGGIRKTFDETFGAVDKWVDKLFRHSISTDMSIDFDKASKHAEKFSDKMSSELGGVTASVKMSTASGNNALPPPIAAKPAVSSSDANASLINAVHMPQWYARYEQVFNARMMALEKALVAKEGVAPKGSSRAVPNPKKMKGVKDAGLNNGLSRDIYGNPTEAEE